MWKLRNADSAAKKRHNLTAAIAIAVFAVAAPTTNPANAHAGGEGGGAKAPPAPSTCPYFGCKEVGADLFWL